MKETIIIATVYLLGFGLSYSMLRIEHEAEGRVYTRLNRLANVLFSLFSFAMVVVIMAVTWFKKIGALGYWDKPVKKGAK
jgi:hypothetical protein